MIVLTQPGGYRKQPASAMPVMRLLMRRTPKIAEAMSVRHEMYNRQMEAIDRREASGEALVIRPPRSLGVRRTERDPEALERVYQIGVQEAERHLPDIESFLSAASSGMWPLAPA